MPCTPSQSAEIQCIVLEALCIVQNEMMVSLENNNERIMQHMQELPDTIVPPSSFSQIQNSTTRVLEETGFILDKIYELQNSTAMILDRNSLLHKETDSSVRPPNFLVPSCLEALSSVVNNTNNNNNCCIQRIRLLVLENHYLTDQCCCMILKYKLGNLGTFESNGRGEILSLFQNNSKAMQEAKDQLTNKMVEASDDVNIVRVKSMNSTLQQRIQDIEGISSYRDTYDIDLISYSLETVSKDLQDLIPVPLLMENKALSEKAKSSMMYTRLKNYFRTFTIFHPRVELQLPARWM